MATGEVQKYDGVQILLGFSFITNGALQNLPRSERKGLRLRKVKIIASQWYLNSIFCQ